MAKEELDNEHTLTKETKKAIEDIIYQKKSIARDQEALKEAIEAVAEKVREKKGILSRRVNLIIKVEEKGGELKSQSTDLEFVEKYFNIE